MDIFILILVFVASVAIEAFALRINDRKVRLFLGGLSGIFIGLVASLSLITLPIAYALLFVFFSYFRFINMLTVIRDKKVYKYMIKRVQKSAHILDGLALLALISGYFIPVNDLTHIYGYGVLVIAMLALIKSVITLLQTRKYSKEYNLTDDDLPTVTVAIPARNESELLTSCIQNILDTNYPKLEILVLDDCSQDKTAQIIKEFAHKGVRFIKGKSSDDSWLPVNYAYQQLAEHASGEYIMFSSVGVEYQEHTIQKLISIIKQNNLKMISVLAHKNDSYGWKNAYRPLRYWGLFLTLGHRQVSDASWIIERSTLSKLGNFAGVKKAIYPERYFAQHLWGLGTYKLVSLSTGFDVVSNRSAVHERKQALRKRYPDLDRSIPRTSLLLLAQFTFLLLPFGAAILYVNSYAMLLVFSAAVIWLFIDALILRARNVKYWWLLPFSLPVSIVVEIFLTHESMRRYEFGSIDWRGRNVCLPVLERIPRLPKV